MSKSSELLDFLQKVTETNGDAALGRRLGIQAPAMCRIRKGHQALTPGMILRIHEEVGMPVAEIRSRAGLPAYVPNAR